MTTANIREEIGDLEDCEQVDIQEIILGIECKLSRA
jgi:hypothetical protein